MIRIIVAIGWLYVVVLMAATQESWLAALGTLFFYCVLPLGVTLYLLGTPARARRRRDATRPDASTPPPPPAQSREASGRRDPH